MRKWIKQWLFREELEKQERELHTVLGTRTGISLDLESTAVQPHVRMGALTVMNGKLLEVSTYKRNSNGPDWMTDYWILTEDQPLSEQIAVVMKLKGLEK